MVEAEQTSTGAYWSSQPDSGYSVDNIPPAEPAPFGGINSGGSTLMHWRENGEPDLSHYNLYRGSAAAFVPAPSNRIASLTDTTFTDATPGGHYYKLSAVDVHGNESPFNLLTPQQIGGAPGVAAPAFWVARAIPNPMRGGTVIRYSLAKAGLASLEIYNASGVMVKRLLSGAEPAGENSVHWDGLDAKGGAAPAGLYFYRLSADGEERTGRLVAVR